MKRWHLNFKNACGLTAGVCVVLLTLITILVPLEQLATTPWRWVVIGLGALAIVGLALQMLKQSREDVDLSGKVDAILAARGMSPEMLTPTLTPTPPTASDVLPKTPDIDGEVYRLVTSPRSVAWPIVRDVFKLQGRADDAAVDTDILVEMYLVNRDSSKTRYVREIQLSAEVNGKRTEFKRQDNLWADDFNDTKFEYGLKEQQGAEVAPINQLSNKFPLRLEPEQPVEGRIRFMAKEINADKVADGTLLLTVIDSVGNEHPIIKAATDRQRRGEIGLRRRS
jgi:hypothetical protein